MSSRASGEREHRRSSSTSASASGHGNDAGANGSSDPTRSRVRVIGDYALGKTLGAGSMGKVKLAHHLVTGERVAIKIVPRSPPPDPSAVGPEAQKAAAKEANKELRTVREAAMSLLVHHPYVCGMREMLVQPSQYLLVLEYVAGGQMLDYIIAHGRLRERVARKFARQIGSALSYCHANSIVHRDLKIENILISSTGDIRLIDFGLSNLYDPHSKLNTFAGSLYFAAPELLNARPYTGPEVDVWSLGVVLYVLVCGRVPFDDQSMPALHAKIKRGAVEYPAWLSADCKALLGRMLVTAPTQRATLPEVLGHPWMNLGYNSPVEVHIPDRIPLRADELDPFIVRGMAGFEFGSDNDVANKLRKILTSESYLRAVARTQGATSNSNSTFATTLGSTSSLDVHASANMSSAASSMLDTPSTSKSPPVSGSVKGSRRFSGLNFGRKLFSSNDKSSGSQPQSPASNSQPHSQGPSRQGSMATSGSTHSLVDPESLLDPTRGFHPLLSVYYMVREKLERERLLSGATDSLGVPTAPDAASTRSGVSGLSGASISASHGHGHGHRKAPTMEAVRERVSAEDTQAEAKAAATPAPTPKGKLRVPDNIRAPAPMHLSSTATEVSGLPSPSPASATYGHSPISGVPTAAAVGSPASNTNPGGPVPKARVVGGPGSSGMMLNLQGLTPMPTAPAAANIQAPKSTAHKRSASSSTPRAPPSSSSAATPREKDARPPGSAPISTTVPTPLAIPKPTLTPIVPSPTAAQSPARSAPSVPSPTSTPTPRPAPTEQDERPLPLPPPKARAGVRKGSLDVPPTHMQVQSPTESNRTITLSMSMPSPMSADPRQSSFAKRFSSLAGRRRTSSLVTSAPPPMPMAGDMGSRRDSVADEVLSDSEVLGGPSSVRSRVSFASRFAPRPRSTLGEHGDGGHSQQTSAASGYSSATERSGTLGRWGTIGRKFKGAKVGSRASSGAGVGVVTPGEERPDPMSLSGGAAALAVVEADEHEDGDDEHDEQSTQQSHASPTMARALPSVVVQPPSTQPNQPEQTQGQQLLPRQPHKLAKKDREHRKDRDHQSFKAVSLKGTFSVATTSTKSAKHLYADVRRTLERMGIPFREIEGGFEVAHEPSIVNGRPVDGAPTESNPPLAITTDAPPQHVEGHETEAEGGTNKTYQRVRPPHLRKKGSKISLASSKSRNRPVGDEPPTPTPRDNDRQHSQSPVVGRSRGDRGESPVIDRVAEAGKGLLRKTSVKRPAEKVLPNRPVTGDETANSSATERAINGEEKAGGRPTTATSGLSATVSAHTEGSSAHPASAQTQGAAGTASASSSLMHLVDRADRARTANRTPSPVPPAPRGRDVRIVHGPVGDREEVEGVFERWSPLGVRFEIHIVKVPILPLHGVQFRRVAGDGWQYHMLARRVLAELKL